MSPESWISVSTQISTMPSNLSVQVQITSYTSNGRRNLERPTRPLSVSPKRTLLHRSYLYATYVAWVV